MKHKKIFTHLILLFSVMLVFAVFLALTALSNQVGYKISVGIGVVAVCYLYIGMPLFMAIYGMVSYKVTGSVLLSQGYIVASCVVSYSLHYVVWNGLLKKSVMNLSCFFDELLEGLPMLLIMMGVSLITSLWAIWQLKCPK